jgi:hypothetical protein
MDQAMVVYLGHAQIERPIALSVNCHRFKRVYDRRRREVPTIENQCDDEE